MKHIKSSAILGGAAFSVGTFHSGSFDEIDTVLRVHIRDALRTCQHQVPWTITGLMCCDEHEQPGWRAFRNEMANEQRVAA